MINKSSCPFCIGVSTLQPTSKGALGALFVLLSFVFGAAVRLRILLYSTGIIGGKRAYGVRVISIGNLTVGGTGKTPVCMMLARMLPGAAIVSRGYGRKSREPVQVVSDGRKVLGVYPDAADEALLCAHELKTVPVICAPRRIRGIRAAWAMFGTRTVVLDDAFSHLAVGRDKNILLVDALDPFGGGKLFPAGRLREPLSSAKRCGAVVITRADKASPEVLLHIRSEYSHRVKYGTPFFTCDIVPETVMEPSGGSQPATEFLRGKNVRLVSGIANPAQFEDTVRSLGATVSAHHAFGDHHPFTAEEVQSICGELREGELLLTTQKDYMRLPQQSHDQFHLLTVAARVREEDEFKTWLLA